MCMYDEIDDENVTIFINTIRKARKSHLCNECGRTIARKEPYHFLSGLWDGRFDSYKTCLHCQIGQHWLQRQCRGFLLGMTQEDLQEHFEEYEMLSIGKLVVGMKREWQRFDGAGLMKLPTMPGEIRLREAA